MSILIKILILIMFFTMFVGLTKATIDVSQKNKLLEEQKQKIHLLEKENIFMWRELTHKEKKGE